MYWNIFHAMICNVVWSQVDVRSRVSLSLSPAPCAGFDSENRYAILNLAVKNLCKFSLAMLILCLLSGNAHQLGGESCDSTTSWLGPLLFCLCCFVHCVVPCFVRLCLLWLPIYCCLFLRLCAVWWQCFAAFGYSWLVWSSADTTFLTCLFLTLIEWFLKS